MSNVNEMRWRLLRERLEKIYQQKSATLLAGTLPDQNVEIFLRLAGATLALLEWHTIDGKGRCRVHRCTGWRWPPWRRRRICPVFATVRFWMEQPLRIVQKTREWY
ncbi:MAG: hypothetical protein ACRDTC_20830 [Pseudonocardiaceae bacterium]